MARLLPNIHLYQIINSNNEAVLTYVVEVQNDATDAWFEAFVAADTSEVVSVTDFVSHATVRVE
jgi:extracellular elastinolytic metalloproteinase